MTLGRWGGRLVSRPLPESDETVDRLDDLTRAAVVRAWLGRSAAEARAGESFVVVRDALIACGEKEELIALADRATDDERRHAELCLLVARRYAGHDVEPPPRLPLDVPKHEGASDELRQSLWIVGQCALNETIASAFLDACLDQAEGPLARAALRELLSDEIDHARIGWAHLTSLQGERRAEVRAWLPRLIAAYHREWRKPGPPRPTPLCSAHGLIAPESIERALQAAQRDVITPGLTRCGY